MKLFRPFHAVLLLFTIVVAFTFAFSAAAAPGKEVAQASPSKGASSSEACLKCHGPFDKLASEPQGYVTDKGEKVAPHRYVPHDLKELPDCLTCHKAHSARPTKTEIRALPKANVNTCYSCHHAENFKPCKSCHGK